MPAETDDIPTLSLTDKSSGRLITRLQYRGWFVDVDATVVSVPRQIITTQRPADLQVCLAAARTMASINAPPAAAPNAPESTPADAIVSVLQNARTLAADKWHPTNFDLHVCTRTAWEETNLDVAFTDVLNAVRRGLEPGINLTEYSDNARPGDILALYDKAIAKLAPADHQDAA